MYTIRHLGFLFALSLLFIASCNPDDEDPVSPNGGAGGGAPITIPEGCPGASTVTDIDGNVYPVVQIGNQCWMAENLRTTRYQNGQPIPNVTAQEEWNTINSDASCSYQNNSANDYPHGRIYNWYAANDQPPICPQGWHVPSDGEWVQMEIELGVPATEAYTEGPRGTAHQVGGKMKTTGTIEAGTGLWLAPNYGATNASGFSAISSRSRSYTGFTGLGGIDTWWNKTAWNAEQGMQHTVRYDVMAVYRSRYNVRNGFCIRCIRN